MSSKQCFKCLETLPLEAFYRHSMMGDGRLNKCKECTKKDVIENRRGRLDYYRSFDRRRASQPHRVAARYAYARTEQGKLAHARATKRWQVLHAKRRRAINMVNNAVRDGRLMRLPCFVCGIKAQAHHPDYDRPLDVMWLCPRHHKDAHAVSKETNAHSA